MNTYDPFTLYINQINAIMYNKGNPNRDPDGRFGTGKSNKDLLGDNPSIELIRKLDNELNLSKTWPTNKGTEDQVLKRIAIKQKLNGKVKKVPKDIFLKELEKERPDIYRGFDKKEHLSQYIDGEYWVGSGLFGSGTYGSDSKKVAKGYTSDNSVLRMTIDSNFKFGNYYGDISTQMRNTGSKLTRKYSDTDFGVINSIYSNPGRYAALRGFDGIFVKNIEDNSQFIILNRGKVIMETN